MSDILTKGLEMPKSCYSGTWDLKGNCLFTYSDYEGNFHCALSECKCLKTKRPNGCPLVEYPTDFIRSLVQDLERLSDRVHELSQAYMSNDLYDVHTDLAECIESIKIVFGKEARE